MLYPTLARFYASGQRRLNAARVLLTGALLPALAGCTTTYNVIVLVPPPAHPPFRPAPFLHTPPGITTTPLAPNASFSPGATNEGDVIVPGTAMPWLWAAGGLNSTYQFGEQDGTRPASVPLSGVNAKPGMKLIISYVSGQICIGAAWPRTDADGTPNPYGSSTIASTGRPIPATYMPSYPVALGELVGAFTDQNGQLIAPPFPIGDGPTQETIPAGAAQLQLGVNDDIYGDNSGSFSVAVQAAP